MKRISLLAVLSLFFAASVYAENEEQRPTYDLTTASGTYQVIAGTIAFTSTGGLGVSSSSPTFTPTIILDGDNGVVTAARFVGEGAGGGIALVKESSEPVTLAGGGGPVYVSSGTYLCIPDAWLNTKWENWTILYARAYTLFTSTVTGQATTFNIGKSTTTDNTGMFTNLLAANLSVPANAKYSDIVAVNETIGPWTILFLQCTGIPLVGDKPAEFGIELYVVRIRP